MNYMTPTDAKTRSLLCLQKGKKGTVAIVRNEDGNLIFCAPRIRQPILRLSIHMGSAFWTESDFDGFLILRSSYIKNEHWATLLQPTGETAETMSLTLSASSLTDPTDFSCIAVMDAPDFLRKNAASENADFLTYRMRLHGAAGAAMLVQDNGAAQLASLEISLEREQFSEQVRADNTRYMDGGNNYGYDENAQRTMCSTGERFR